VHEPDTDIAEPAVSEGAVDLLDGERDPLGRIANVVSGYTRGIQDHDVDCDLFCF
jgi:hypothetical protein